MGAHTQHIKMLKKPDVTDLAGEKVMIDFDSGKYFMLKGAANDIWDLMEDGLALEALFSSLMQIYDVDEATCRETTMQFLHNIEQHGFIRIEGT